MPDDTTSGSPLFTFDTAAISALARGSTGLWYARFPVNPGDSDYEAVLGYEREWHRAFRGRPVVTICPFITGGLDETDAATALEEVSQSHTGVLVAEGDGHYGRVPPRR